MRILGCLLMMGMIFLYPSQTADAARQALYIFGLDIIPTLFPYMVLTRLLVTRLNVSSRASLLFSAIFGCLGGSPSGASMIQLLAANRPMKRRDAYALCALTGTISPIFLLNTVGSWLSNTRMTIILTTAHFAGALLAALAVHLYMRNDCRYTECHSSPAQFTEDNLILSCAISVLGIGGCLVFYSVLSEVISLLVFSSESSTSSIMHALFEISGGIREIISHSAPGAKYILLSIVCGFSGISILSQNALLLKRAGISFRLLMLLGILRASFSAMVMLALLPLYIN